MTGFCNPRCAPRTLERRRQRNARYAPESLERKLSPSTLYPAGPSMAYGQSYPTAEYGPVLAGETRGETPISSAGDPIPTEGGEGSTPIDPAEPDPQPGDGSSPDIEPYFPVGPAGPA
jgi:hypothetical protein